MAIKAFVLLGVGEQEHLATAANLIETFNAVIDGFNKLIKKRRPGGAEEDDEEDEGGSEE